MYTLIFSEMVIIRYKKPFSGFASSFGPYWMFCGDITLQNSCFTLT